MILNIKRPAWLDNIEEQVTVIPKSTFLREKLQSGGREPIPAMLNKDEEVVPAPVVDALGGSAGLTKAINNDLPPNMRLTGDPGRVGATTPLQSIRGLSCGSVGKLKNYASGTVGAPARNPGESDAAYAARMATLTGPGGTAPTAGTASVKPTAPDTAPKPLTPDQAKTVQTNIAAGGASAVPVLKAFQAGGEQGLRDYAATQARTLQAPSTTQGTASVASPIMAPVSRVIPVATTTAAQGSIATPQLAPGTGSQQPNQPQANTASPYGETAVDIAIRNRTMADLQARSAAQQIASAQDLAQRGIKGAAASTLAAEQQAQGESARAKAGAELGIAAGQREAAAREAEKARKFTAARDALNVALQSKDFTGFNAALKAIDPNIPPVDFSRLNEEETIGNLMDLAERFPDAAEVFMAPAIERWSRLAGVELDPSALDMAITDITGGNWDTPEAKALARTVGSLQLTFLESPAGQVYVEQMKSTPEGKRLLTAVKNGTATDADLESLGEYVGIMYALGNASEGTQFNDSFTQRATQLGFSVPGSSGYQGSADRLLTNPPTDWKTALGSTYSQTYKDLVAKTPDASTYANKITKTKDRGAGNNYNSIQPFEDAYTNKTLVNVNGKLLRVSNIQTKNRIGYDDAVYTLTDPITGQNYNVLVSRKGADLSTVR